MKRSLLLGCLTASLLMFAFSGCSCEHEWQEATCTEPKTCAKCGETEGEAHGHEWQEATCTEPKICMVCGKTEGNALGHTWQEATCVKPKTCSICSVTDGEPLEHTPGEWEIDESSRSMESGTVWVRQYCQICGTQIDRKLKSFSLDNGSIFLFTPQQFSERLNSIFSLLDDCTYTAKLGILDDNTMTCAIFEDEAIAAILFNDNTSEMNGDLQNSATIESLMTYFYTDDISEIVPAMLGIILTCDNTLEISDAADVGKALVLASLSNEPYYKNDIGYVFGENNGSYMLVVSLRKN